MEMKKALLFTMCVFVSITSFSQDIISLKKGKRVEAIVTEITPTLVRYKLFSEPKGREYFIYKDDVAGIMYKDGRVEAFNQSSEQTIENTPKTDVRKPRSVNRNQDNKETNQSFSKEWNNENNDKKTNNREINHSLQETNSVPLSRNNNYLDVVYLKNGSVIRGTIIEQIPNESIKIETNDDSIFVYSMDGIEKITKIPQTPKRAIRETRNLNSSPRMPRTGTGLQRGYKGMLDFGYSFGDMNRIHLNYINGVQATPYFSFGVGTGIHYYFNSSYYYFDSSYGYYYGYNDNRDDIFIPLFLDFRFNFMNRRVSPYLSFDLGYAFDASNDFETGGALFNLTAGVTFKTSRLTAIHLGLGFEGQAFDGFDYMQNAVALKFGFSF
jgi:hypothetical protein